MPNRSRRTSNQFVTSTYGPPPIGKELSHTAPLGTGGQTVGKVLRHRRVRKKKSMATRGRLEPRRDFERFLNPPALGSEDAFCEAKEVAVAEAEA